MTTVEQINAANASFCKLFELQDADAIARLYTSDAQIFPAHCEPLFGQAAIRDFWAGVMQAISFMTLESAQVDQQGNTAIETGSYALLGPDGLADRGKYVVVWKHENGEWKIQWDIWNTSVPATVAVAA